MPVTNPSHWDKHPGQVQPVPVGQADWDRLGFSHWDRQAACTKPVPLGLGKVKKDPFVPCDKSYTHAGGLSLSREGYQDLARLLGES